VLLPVYINNSLTDTLIDFVTASNTFVLNLKKKEEDNFIH